MDETMLLWGLGLLAAGLLLLVIEIFVPSGGLLGIASAVVALAGVVCLFRYDVMWGIIGMCAMMILGPTVVGFGLKVWPHTPVGRRMLNAKSPEQIESDMLAARQERDRLAAMIGREGTAMTDLRPIGVVTIDGQRYDALAETGWIPAQSRIRVTQAEPNHLRVRVMI